MKNKTFVIWCLSLLTIFSFMSISLAFAQLSPFLRIEEEGGETSGILTKLIVPKGSLTPASMVGHWRIKLSGVEAPGEPVVPSGLTIDCYPTYQQSVIKLTPNVGNQLIIGPNYDQDFDHEPYSYPTLIIHSKRAPDSDNTEWFSINHRGHAAWPYEIDGVVFRTGSNGFWFQPEPTYHVNLKDCGILQKVRYGTLTPYLESCETDFKNYPHVGFTLVPDYNRDQLLFGVHPRTGNQLIITNHTSRDHGHDPQVDPSVYIHSRNDPYYHGNKEYLYLTHNTTDGIIDVGTGSIVHRANVVMQEKLNYARSSVECPDNAIEASPAVLNVPTINSSHIMITCLDTDGCSCWLSEAEASIGDLLWIYVDPNGSECFFLTIADQQQTRLADRITVTTGGMVSFTYEGDAWVQATQETK